jgi:N-acetylglucosaminyldiphosphoundecaprenol N-acetyl-beta-D-mannosaminyltransferase
MEQSIQRCEELIKLRGKQHVVINAAKVVAADESKELKAIISSCDLINADGMSIVWASRLLGAPVPERVAGIDLMYSLVEMSRDKNYSIHLLGASESVSLQVAKTFSDYGANVIGRRNGYWEIEEEESIVQEVASLAPDILFVAIPSPT